MTMEAEELLVEGSVTVAGATRGIRAGPDSALRVDVAGRASI